MKKADSNQIPIKKFLSEFKEIKKVYTDSEYELAVLRNIPTKKKVLCIKKYQYSQAGIMALLRRLQVYDKINQFKFVNRFIGYALNNLQKNKKSAFGFSVNLVYEFGETSLQQFVKKNSKSQQKRESLVFVRYFFSQLMDALVVLQNVADIQLGYFQLNHQLIVVNNYGEITQEIKFCYLPFDFIKSHIIRYLDFNHEIYSSRDLREVNQQRKKSSQALQSSGELADVILESERETEHYNCNQQIFQKIGLCILKCVYFLCQDIEINEIVFEFYTMNEKFDVDFNWNLIVAFLAECQNHKDYHSWAKIIHFMIRQCQEERSFKEYLELVKYIQQKFYKKSQLNRSPAEKMLKSMHSQEQKKEDSLNFAQSQKLLSQSKKRHFNSLQQIQQILKTKTAIEIVYDDGTIYFGQMKDGQRQGLGIYRFSQDQIYGGEWKDNEMFGRGFYLFASHQRYSGEIRGQIKQGYGTYEYKNGNKYTGEWKNDLKQGYGEFTCAQSGQIYKGFFKQNYKEGKGVCYFPNNQKFQGNFSNGLKHGNGCLYDREGRIFLKGKWVNDQIEGKVEMFLPNNDYYTGQVLNNQKHGNGIYTFSDGTIYEGSFVEDEMTGNCLIRYINGDTYEGQILKGKLNGKGRYYYKKADVFYEGDWIQGVEDGLGKYIYKNQIMMITTQRQRELLRYSFEYVKRI